jgi:hypothetical protein
LASAVVDDREGVPDSGRVGTAERSETPVKSTVPATFNWEYSVSTVVPSIWIANSAPSANETPPAVTSVPIVSGCTPPVPGASSSVPPAVSIEPGSNTIAPPLIN